MKGGEVIEDRFSQDGAAEVAGAEEKNIHVLIWVLSAAKRSLQTSIILAI
jgi:hypothetical protein